MGGKIELDSEGEGGSKVRIGGLREKGVLEVPLLSPFSLPGNETIVPWIIPTYIYYYLL